MMKEHLAELVFAAGIAHFFVLIASALVPVQLKWSDELAKLPKLMRQLFWVYGAYIVLAIVAFGVLSVCHAEELTSGSGLARGLCGYIAIFWAVRLLLQLVFDVRPHLNAWWLKVGYHLLTVVFSSFSLLYAFAALS